MQFFQLFEVQLVIDPRKHFVHGFPSFAGEAHVSSDAREILLNAIVSKPFVS